MPCPFAVCLVCLSFWLSKHVTCGQFGIESVVEKVGNKKEHLSWKTLTYKSSWNACILCFGGFVSSSLLFYREHWRRSLKEKSFVGISWHGHPSGWGREAYNPNERKKNVSSCKDGESLTVTETYCDKDLPPSRP